MSLKAKKILAACLMLAVAASALAAPLALAAPALSDRLLTAAKDVLSLLSYGEYQKAFAKARLDERGLSVDDFQKFVETKLPDVATGTVQQDVTVGFYDGIQWLVAIPVLEPVNGDVQALVFTSVDGRSFDSYTNMTWSDVLKAVDASTDVVWDDAYQPKAPLVVPDDPGA